MSHTIEHFMWGFQSYFRIGQECAAQRVFQALDPRFRPHIFLVGVSVEERTGRFPACVEPEDDFWIQSEAFFTLGDHVQNKISSYPENQLSYSHLIAQETQNDQLIRRAVQELILQTISESETRPGDQTFFVSFPVLVNGFLVSTVLSLQTDVLGSHHALTKDAIPLHELRDVPVPRSLIDAVIEQFLVASSVELERPNAGAGLSQIDTDETLRKAAFRFMNGIVWRIDRERLRGMHKLFESCNTIASLHYERQSGSGSIILARRDHPSVVRQVNFKTPTDITDSRAARKLLQLVSEALSLHSDSEEIYGLATVGEYDPTAEDLFTVRILDHHHWELVHAGTVLMRVKYGQPYLPKPPFDEARLRSDLHRIFQGIENEHIDRIIDLVHQAERERHGTMLVITPAAEGESQRLRNQATPLEPCVLTPDLLKHLTPIDGSVLLSPDGVCYAAGVILDGMAKEHGDPGRGARFNSALRYVASLGAPCLAVVISEDRGIDFVPDLCPAIKRLSIDGALKQLREMGTKENVNRRLFNELHDWFNEHRFYLLPSDCDEVNSLIDVIDAKLDRQEPSNIHIVRNPFTPDPMMNSQMYYENE